jgi:hypothetical protein
MANEVKKYFLAPNWDCIPGDGRIALGNIVALPINPVPALVSVKTAEEDAKVLRSSKTDVEWSQEKHGEKRFGIWTKFLQSVLGISIDLGVSRQSSQSVVFQFEKMVTEEIFLGEDEDVYVKEAVKAKNVQRYLKRSKFKKPVFMIVGIKWVTGAVVKRVAKRDEGGKLLVSVDATGQGVPVSLGPEISVSSGSGDSVSFKGSSDFVFALRVRKVRISQDGEVDTDEFGESDGAVFGDEADEGGYAQKVKILGLEAGDAGHTSGELVLDGQETVIVSTGV